MRVVRVRVLLDEDIDVRLRHEFSSEHEVETVQFRGWKGLKNGELLARASRDFDVLVTMDDNLPEQRNVGAFDLRVVILRARSKRLPDLASLIPELERRVPDLRPGDAVRIHPPS